MSAERLSLPRPTKEQLADFIAHTVRNSGLSFDDQIKALSMARVAIQPRRSETDWRAKSKPILKPKEKAKKQEKAK